MRKKKNEKEDGGQSSYGKFFITRFLYVGENDGGAGVWNWNTSTDRESTDPFSPSRVGSRFRSEMFFETFENIEKLTRVVVII